MSQFKYVYTQTLDLPKFYPYSFYSAALPLPNHPGQFLLLGSNKNKRGSNNSLQYSNAKVTDGYDVLLFNGKNITKMVGPFDTPHEASQAMETMAPHI